MGDETMVGFGFKQAWLAVRDVDPDPVAAALGLHDLGPVPWRDGIDLAYLQPDRLALTPPLPGAKEARWTLIAGRWLLSTSASVDVAELSRTLDTEVQFFATYRVGELHRWERAVRGALVRVFSYVGETGEVTGWLGDPDDTERDIGLPPALDTEIDILVSEQDVLRMAGAWSVNPATLDGQPAPGRLRLASAP